MKRVGFYFLCWVFEHVRRTDNGVAIYQRDIGTSFGLRFLVEYLKSRYPEAS